MAILLKTCEKKTPLHLFDFALDDKSKIDYQKSFSRRFADKKTNINCGRPAYWQTGFVGEIKGQNLPKFKHA